MGVWEIWWVVLLGLCLMIVICEEICERMLNLSCWVWVKLTHSVLGFYDDVCDVCVLKLLMEKLIEMKGRVNLGLKSENVVIWVEKCDALRVWKAKFGFSGSWRLKWVNLSFKCHLGLMGKLRLNKWRKWVTKVKTRAISRVNGVLKGQILIRWNFRRKTSLSKFRLRL